MRATIDSNSIACANAEMKKVCCPDSDEVTQCGPPKRQVPPVDRPSDILGARRVPPVESMLAAQTRPEKSLQQ